MKFIKWAMCRFQDLEIKCKVRLYDIEFRKVFLKTTHNKWRSSMGKLEFASNLQHLITNIRTLLWCFYSTLQPSLRTLLCLVQTEVAHERARALDAPLNRVHRQREPYNDALRWRRRLPGCWCRPRLRARARPVDFGRGCRTRTSAESERMICDCCARARRALADTIGGSCRFSVRLNSEVKICP